MHFTGIWIVTYITFQCYSLFSKFGVLKIGIIISSSKISWAVPFNTWTKNFMKLLQGHKNMNWMCVIYIMWHTWWGRWRKFRMTFTVFFFFSKWPKEQLQSFDFNQNVAILENYNGLLCQYLSYQGQFLAMTMEDCQDHQFLLLKHQDFMQTTKYSLKLSKFTKNRINLK